MIESIQVANTATYDLTPEVLDDLSSINFFFGSNGSGKTTISRVIAKEENFSNCHVRWKGGTKLQPLVYNRDFINANFSPSSILKGVFTMGKKNIETLDKITEAKNLVDRLTEKIESLKANLQGENGHSGRRGELARLNDELKEKCWSQKQKHDEKFAGAFTGFRSNSQKFCEKIIAERVSNPAILQPLEYLDKKAETVFGKSQCIEQPIPVLDVESIVANESDPVLKKIVIGKENVDIAAMIQKLNNSDWVKKGRVFYQSNDRVCPFCQQRTTDEFEENLREYFDETFEKDSRSIEKLDIAYKKDSDQLQQQIQSIIDLPSKFLDLEKLESERGLFVSKCTVNLQRITTKKKEPSKSIKLESLVKILTAIKTTISNANGLISENNSVLSNLQQERTKLTTEVWKFLVETELKEYLEDYDKKQNALSKAIASITKQIEAKTKEKEAKKLEIQTLEKGTTSIQPTVDGINSMLSDFGFQNFSLAKTEEGNFYKIVRPDGSDVKETLSEGERSFITFLYFYHLLKGSDSESGMTTNRIVVFDDPVSSLDSDILFIVGSLIKGIFSEIRDNSGYIKQVFVLTHNVYFHKEVTFNSKRVNKAMNEETFWVVRKSGSKSKVINHDENPIKTSYELLWTEVRNPDCSNLTIQNVLRRILENYFKILGGIDPDKICEMFEGENKFICKSLFSWVNDGSHYAHDDLYISIDSLTVDKYLDVFRSIFEKSNHFAHYEMMMGEAYLKNVIQSTG